METASYGMLPAPSGRWLSGRPGTDQHVLLWDLTVWKAARPLALRRRGSWYGALMNFHPADDWVADFVRWRSPTYVPVMSDGIADAAAGLFYGRLFELDPTLRPLFRGDLREQGRKLMTTLGVVVKGLTKLDAILPAVEQLGARHVAYGVQDAHYATVGAALLWTLRQGLGTAFTADVEDAWTAAYTTLAGAMIAAAHRAAPAVMTEGMTA